MGCCGSKKVPPKKIEEKASEPVVVVAKRTKIDKNNCKILTRSIDKNIGV